MRQIFTILFAVFSFPFFSIQASTIYLRDGQILDGVQNLREFEKVFLYEQNTRNISIPKDRIQKIVDDQGKTIFETFSLSMKQRNATTDTVVFDIFVNDAPVAVGEWYDEGKFRVSSGKVPDGNYQEYYPSGRVKRDYTFKNGNLNGICKEYYASGIVERESTMINGMETGISRNYHQSGQLEGESEIVNGEKNGTTKLYYESGKVRSIMHYVKGKMVGNQQVFYESGQVEVEVEFKDGVKEGPIHQYYETGNIKMAGEFKSGVLEGEVVYYYESGRVKERKMLRNGRIIDK